MNRIIMSISLPHELREKMRLHDKSLGWATNWSAICQEAIRQELQKPNVSEIVKPSVIGLLTEIRDLLNEKATREQAASNDQDR